MAKGPKSFCGRTPRAPALTHQAVDGRRGLRPLATRNWEPGKDAISAAQRAEIAAVLATPRIRRCGRPESAVPGGPRAQARALDLAEALGAIASPVIRRRILDLARQIDDAD